MIGEGNVVQHIMGVVGVERAPAAVRALHPDHPFGGARDAVAVFFRIRPVQRHRHDRGVVDVGVVVVAVLERPAAGANAGPG